MDNTEELKSVIDNFCNYGIHFHLATTCDIEDMKKEEDGDHSIRKTETFSPGKEQDNRTPRD